MRNGEIIVARLREIGWLYQGEPHVARLARATRMNPSFLSRVMHHGPMTEASAKRLAESLGISPDVFEISVVERTNPATLAELRHLLEELLDANAGGFRSLRELLEARLPAEAARAQERG